MNRMTLLVLLCFVVAFVTSTEVQFKAIKEQVHEDITLAAARIVGGFNEQQLHDLKKGTQWPDAPCENFNEIGICLTTLAKSALAFQCSFSFRNDYGDYSSWHSMAVPGHFTNKQNLEKILYWSRDWYQKALTHTRGEFHLGKLCHQVGDAFSRSHVWRNSKKEVVLFQRYGDQDSSKHANADKRSGRGTFGIPGANDAVRAITDILRIFKDRKPWKELRRYLRSNVYKFALLQADQPAGGSHPDFSCGRPGCGYKAIKSPARSTIVVVKNWTKELFVRQNYGLPGGCWTCYDDNNQILAGVREPCPVIRPGELCVFKSESCGMMTGTEGWVQYATPSGRAVAIQYTNAYIGKNTYNCPTKGFPEGSCTRTGGKGNNAGIAFTVTG